MTLLELESLQISIAGQPICNHLNLQLRAGQMLGILGRNGTGKTTLLHTLMGFHRADQGRILLDGHLPHTGSRRDMARRIGLLFQESDSTMPATVLETVLLGRHPHSDNLLWDSAEDLNIASTTLQLVGLDDLAQRQVSSLSGGEKQRLAVALLMVQSPSVYLLDEPSNHLDIDYQSRILDLLRRRIASQGAGLIMASHDINLAARYCQRALLLMGDGVIMEGPAEEVLIQPNLEQAFRCPIAVVESEGRRYFLPR
ncbi:MAG: ABC transporter ATP-binding protein [Gammaproteobacteria bacterium]|nr:ABC transporter ATP-binding protein [Pseudomonadales bacterium]MCP5345594.1 ABC transporter ATP-binding protein [Pseudomonadales bacterium]